MISVVINWCYILVTSVLVGMLCNGQIEKRFRCSYRKLDELVFAGLIVITSMTQVLSFFYKIGLVANVILLVVCAISALVYRKELIELFLGFKKCSAYKVVVFLMGALILCYFTSRGYYLFDAGLYHGQAVRWLEEYGTVIGLGNLHCRLGYNSTSFVLTALYSMAFLVKQSMHTVGGFFAIMLWGYIIFGYGKNEKKTLRVSDFLRVGAIFYLTTTFSFLQTTSTDNITFCLIVYIILKYVDHLEKKETSIAPYALLSVVACFAVTLKLSAAPVVLIVLTPAVQLIREKKIKDIFTYIAMGLFVILPYLIRGVMLSGWLLYPNTTIDLFSFGFKVHEEVANGDQLAMILWGRDAAYGESFGIWFPRWFQNAGGFLVKAMLVGDFLSFFGLAILWIKEWKTKTLQWATVVLDLTTLASLLFWFFACPLVRYGYIFIIVFLFHVVGRWMATLSVPWLYKVFQIGVISFVLIKICTTIQFGMHFIEDPYYVWQQDYECFEGTEVAYGEFLFYLPSETAQSGYHNFPSYLEEIPWEMRGDEIRDGFQMVE